MKKLLLLCTAMAFGLMSLAQTNTFNNDGGDGFWINDDNWSLDHIPNVSETAVIPNTFTVTIQSTVDAVAKNVEVETGGSLIVNGKLSPGIVTSPTGRIWMDRNLGASRVATKSADATAYGDLYQWGRATEGHEKRGSGKTTTNATTPEPNEGNGWDGLFITEGSSPYDWLTTQDNTLWQGVNGTNNPCPSGFRLPTKAEWEAEYATWSSQDEDGAFASPLKLTLAGTRSWIDGSLTEEGLAGWYWSSTTETIAGREDSHNLYFIDNSAGMSLNRRAHGFSVRCIKE